ncbi:MAG: AIR synthase related protein, partial [Ignavibacteria bacterium]
REKKEPEYLKSSKNMPALDIRPEQHSGIILDLLAQSTITNKRWIFEQYDSQVRTNTVTIKGDAPILRIKEIDGFGIAVSTDCNSRYVYLDPYKGGMMAVAEAARNVACVGAEPVAITNCLNFGNPYDPEVYWQFTEAIRGMGDACRAFNTPVTGGNVSFHNESQKHAIFPTPTIGMLGLISDLTHTVGAGFTEEDAIIALLGWQEGGLEGSELLKMKTGTVAGNAPAFSLDREVILQKTIIQLIQHDLVLSAHDTAEGGLAIAIAESCLANGIGAALDLPFEENAESLFGEAQNRIVISMRPSQFETAQAIADEAGIPLQKLGLTGGHSINGTTFSITLTEAHRAYMDTLASILS